jgi:hypothetical protein
VRSLGTCVQRGREQSDLRDSDELTIAPQAPRRHHPRRPVGRSARAQLRRRLLHQVDPRALPAVGLLWRPVAGAGKRPGQLQHRDAAQGAAVAHAAGPGAGAQPGSWAAPRCRVPDRPLQVTAAALSSAWGMVMHAATLGAARHAALQEPGLLQSALVAAARRGDAMLLEGLLKLFKDRHWQPHLGPVAAAQPSG